MATPVKRNREQGKASTRTNGAKAQARPRKRSSPFLSVDEAALYLRVTARALEHYRGEGGGPDYRKHGGSIVYHKLDLDRWSALRRFSSTSKKAEP